jgi:hypothetical protein
MERRQTRTGGSRVVAIVVSVLAGVPFLLGLFSVLTSAFGDDSGDPHGYALIFGTLLCVVTGVFLLLALPVALPQRWRRVTGGVSTTILLLFAAVLLVVAGAAYL